jgi:hypothetical protein
MRVTNVPEPAGRHDPMHDAPRRLLEELERRLAAEDMRALRGKRPETVGRTISPAVPLDAQPDDAVYDSPLQPLDSDAMGDPRILARELGRRRTLFGVVGRLVAAIGVSAVIAQLFVIMMPAARQPDSAQMFAAAVRSLPQRHQGEYAAKPALAGFQALLASGDTPPAAERAQPEKQSDDVLQRFLRWRHKANPNEAAP